MNTKKLIVKSRTENLSQIRDFISSNAAEAGFSKDEIDNMILAVDEACTNVIKHAYKYSPDGDILIEIKYDRTAFTITIEDNGMSFDPDVVPSPDLQKYYREHRVGGLGMYLMKTLMDEVKYKSVPGKYNRVSLIKKIKAA
ncbi:MULTISPECIES: ATP-binding protein [Ignavibacterium]|uniref:ATP-binding protein n=1 Tax=Ignavibacterium TaxID=795750 RepID=UPI0025B7B608|nr:MULTISPECIES: ATP-binding protein [Ignavibacterium]MBI5661500.1 ATP-binding protein [Ignavibacterium album]